MAFVLLTSIFIIFFTLKWRRNRTTTALTDATQNFEDPSPLRPFSYISTQEIGHQSVQELHNTPYQIELLDRQAPSGSGVELNELPHDGGLSHRESSALVARNSADIFLRWDNRSANNTRDKENDISRLRVAQVPGTLNLPLDKAPSRTTPTKSDSLKSQGSMKGVQADSFPTHLMVDVHKALPHVPLTTAQSKRNHFSLRSSSATSISESIQTPPITYRAVRDAFAQRIHTVAASPRVSLIATYATIFDVEEYKDHAIVSETEFESF